MACKAPREFQSTNTLLQCAVQGYHLCHLESQLIPLRGNPLEKLIDFPAVISSPQINLLPARVHKIHCDLQLLFCLVIISSATNLLTKQSVNEQSSGIRKKEKSHAHPRINYS